VRRGGLLGEEDAGMMCYLMLAAAWCLWCALHSLMVAPAVTRSVQQRLPALHRRYRMVYNLVSLFTLVPVLAYGVALNGPVLFRWEGALRILQVSLLSAALACFVLGARRYDLRQFLGLRPAHNVDDCRALTADCRLDQGGVLGVVRHPWYAGGILLVWARDLSAAALVTSLCVSIYFVVGAMLEERKLVARFGQAYRDYQQRVSMLVPIKWLLQAVRRERT
jgi:protein-S-isoprenylcysteine O-methyltransferase Ste14